MYFARRSLIALLLLGMLLTACGGQPAATESPADINATVAAAAATLAAALFQTQTALAPTITNTSPPTVTPLATNTALALPSPLATSTQQVLFYASPTGTFYTLTPSSSSLAVGCNNMALIRDVTIPSGTVMTPGQTFTKTWQVSNTGTCDWLYSYSLAFGSGDRMGGNGYGMSKKVPPGEWRQFSVELEAPKEPGTYTGYWRMTTGDGKAFGASLGVSIVVKKNPDPTSTNTSAAPTATPNLAQTAAAGAQQTFAAQTAAAAAQNAINTAVAQTLTQAALDAAATAICAQTPAANPQPNPPCVVP